MRPFLFIFLFLVCSCCLQAQNDSISLPTALVLAPRLLHEASGQKAFYLDSAVVAQGSQLNLAELLAENGTFDMRSYGGGSVLMAMRGGGTSHTAVVWNGLNLQNVLSGVTDISLLAVPGLAQIGWRNGGAGAQYGSGAVCGGIFIDQHLNKKRGWSGALGGRLGSFGDARFANEIAFVGPKIDFQIATQHRKSRNDFTFRNTAKLGQPLQEQTDASSELFSVNTQFQLKVGETSALTAFFWHNAASRQLPPTMTAASTRAKQEDSSQKTMLEWKSMLLQWRYTVKMAILSDALFYKSNLVPLSINKGESLLAQTHFWRSWSRWQLKLGAELNHQKATSNNYEAQFTRQNIAAVAAVNYNSKQFGSGLTIRQLLVEEQLVPISIQWGTQKTIMDKTTGWLRNLTLRAAANRQYNLPALNDLHWAGLGNPALKPEKGWSGEIGADLALGAKNKWSFTLYTLQLQDRILWTPGTDGLWRPSNISRSASKGIESAFETRGTLLGLGQWSSKWQYQYCQATNNEGFQLLYVPLHTAAANVALQIKKVGFKFRQSYVSKRYMSADNATFTKPYGLSNVEAIYFLPLRKTQLECSAGMNNIFNAQYQVIRFYAMPGRNYFLSLRWSW